MNATASLSDDLTSSREAASCPLLARRALFVSFAAECSTQEVVRKGCGARGMQALGNMSSVHSA